MRSHFLHDVLYKGVYNTITTDLGEEKVHIAPPVGMVRGKQPIWEEWDEDD